MQLVIDPQGQVRCVYQEAIELSQLGRVSIRRASHVEPDETGHWHADLNSIDGPKLGPYSHRSAALAAEIQWLSKYWLNQ